MLRRVWIPDWLYRLLPRSALFVGFAGVVMINPSFIWTPTSLATLGYGAYVLLARASV